MKFTKNNMNFDSFHLRVSDFFCNLINQLCNSTAQHSYKIALSLLALFGSFFSFAAQPPFYIAENAIVVNANQIYVAASNQPQTAFSQIKSIIFVAENSIVSDCDHFQLQKQNIPTKKKPQLAIAQPKDPIVTKKATHPYWFSKTPLHNKNTYQTLETAATLVPNASKNPLKKIFLKYNYTTHTIKIDQENSVASFYDTPLNEQNNKTYTLLGYLPPPGLPNSKPPTPEGGVRKLI